MRTFWKKPVPAGEMPVMEIGKPVRKIVVEPIRDPVPERAPKPTPEPAPAEREPARTKT